MSLNIKSERVHDLVREAARRTGASQVSVVEAAVTDYLARLEAPDEVERRRTAAREILAEIDALLSDEDREEIRRAAEELYDEDGLPR